MTAQEDKLERVMAQVRNHLARADDPRTPPAEAETARERAEILMFRYKIETVTADNAAPTYDLRWAEIPVSRVQSEFMNHYWTIAWNVAHHCGLRLHYEWKWHAEEDGVERRWLVIDTVGYVSDSMYAETLLTNAMIAFGKALEPKVHADETDAKNALRLRRGGMERHRIALALFGPSSTVNEQKTKNRKVTKLIKEEAARLGDPNLAEEVLGRGNNIKTFRASYAEGFVGTLSSRMRMMAIARQSSGGEGTVVLASIKDAVDEAFYEKYPSERPLPVENRIGEVQEECSRCAKAKSGYCRQHSYRRPHKGRESAWSNSGYNAGSDAARTVDLGSAGRQAIG
jgi:hypothetical protein